MTEKTKRVKLSAPYNSPRGSFPAGVEIDVPKKEGDQLVASGYADDVRATKRQVAAKVPAKTAPAPEAVKKEPAKTKAKKEPAKTSALKKAADKVTKPFKPNPRKNTPQVD